MFILTSPIYVEGEKEEERKKREKILSCVTESEKEIERRKKKGGNRG